MTDLSKQRLEAEARLLNVPENLQSLTPAEIQRTLHELRVHQIQLEMQNEELRRMQIELDTARELYCDLYDMAPVSYLTLSEEGIILQANLTATTLLNVPRSKLVGKPLTRFILKEDQEIFYHHRKQLMQTSGPHESSLRMVKQDGTPFWAALTSITSQDAGDVTTSRVMLSDITERKLHELTLAARTRLLVFAQTHTLTELLTATLDEAEALTGSQIGFYHFLEADQTMLSLQVWSTHTTRRMCQAEGAGRHYPVDQAGVWVDCIHQRRPVIHNNYASLPHRKGLPAGHATVLRELVAPVIRNDKIVAILGVGNKITDYGALDIQTVTSLADLAWSIARIKQTEERLLASEEKFRAIANYTVDWESWFGPDGSYLWLNPAVERITGYTPDEVLAMPDFTTILIDGEDREIFRQRFMEALQGTPGTNFVFRFRHKNGSLRWLSASWQSIFDANGHCLGVRTSGRDITERKRKQDLMAFLARTSGGTTCEPFFHALARYLANSLDMDFICIDHLEDDGLNARTVTVWCDGHFEDNVTYALKDTPCGEVVSKQMCCYQASVCQIFPHDQVLQDLRAECYVGTTLWSHVGQPIGLIAMIGRKPLENRTQAESTLQLVAERCASELEQLVADEDLKKSLHEKEVLLKEIHHRVKNNLQIMSSLLHLQANHSDDPNVKASLKDMQNRVLSMAMIHAHLYRSDNLAAVDMANYLKTLAEQLRNTLLDNPAPVLLQFDLSPLHLEIDQAIPCGLLANELITNALKHAFPAGRIGTLRIALHSLADSPEIHFSVTDDGIGLPPDFSLDHLKSLGLQVAVNLARQLGGTLNIGPGPDTHIEVTFVKTTKL